MQVLFVRTKNISKQTCVRSRNCSAHRVGTAPCVRVDQPPSATAASSTQRVIAISTAAFTWSKSAANACSR